MRRLPFLIEVIKTHYQYVPYIWPLIASAAASASLGIYAFAKRRNAKSSACFILSMAVVTIWSAGNALEMSGADFATKLFWANMQYFAYCYSPVTLLALCMQFTGHEKLFQNKRIWWFALLPTIIILLVWTDGLHGLIRYDMHMDYSGVFPVIVKKYGPVFYIHAAYAHALNITAWVMLVRAVFIKNTVYRRQAVALFLGVSMIIIPNVFYILGLSPLQFDITPVFFGPAGLLMAWAIFRYKMFDLVPLARSNVVETMDAGMMVLDLQDRILDINPAFEKITGYRALQVIGRSADAACKNIPELAGACMDRNVPRAEFTVRGQRSERIYEALLSPLEDRKNVLIGRLVLINDITEIKQAQQTHLKQQRKLAVIEDRERMARDMHDNLGQLLGCISLQAQGIRQELVTAGVKTALIRIDKLVEVSQTANEEIRSYIKTTRNSVLQEKDFIVAFQKEVARFEEQSGIAARLDLQSGFNSGMTQNVCVAILQIVKEALRNVQKHSQAEYVKISFVEENDALFVSIEDNGKGFIPALHNDSQGTSFGLNIMRERALEIGGRLHVESAPEKGCRVVLKLPIEPGRNDSHEINACG
jgi:PAS domain S-box-containing protein